MGPAKPAPAESTTDPDWIPADSFLDPSAAHLGQAIDWVSRSRSTDHRVVAASIFSLGYSSLVVLPVVYSWAASRRVPDFGADNVLVRISEGGGIRLGLKSDRWGVLASDSFASDARAIVVDSEADLVDWTRTRIIDAHLAHLVVGLRGVSRIGQRMVWGNITSRLAAAVSLVAQLDPELVVKDTVDAFLAPSPSPMAGHVSLHWVGSGDTSVAVTRRSSCCVRFKLDNRGYCSDCKLVPLEDQLAAAERTAASRRATFDLFGASLARNSKSS